MNKLKCFRCNHRFHYYHQAWNPNSQKIELKLKKGQIYKDEFGYPICEDCLLDQLHDDWTDPEIIIQQLNEYNYSYEQYMASLFFVDCPKCQSSIAIDITHDNQEQRCWDCPCFFFTKDQKITESWDNEDMYIESTEEKDVKT